MRIVHTVTWLYRLLMALHFMHAQANTERCIDIGSCPAGTDAAPGAATGRSSYRIFASASLDEVRTCTGRACTLPRALSTPAPLDELCAHAE